MKSAKWENIFKGWDNSESEAVHTLKKIPVFKDLSHKDFNELENMMHHRDYKAGDFIFKNPFCRCQAKYTINKPSDKLYQVMAY